MADEAFALSPISARATLPGEADYDAISAAFMETSRGRWFLSEYAKRNRNADTRMVLDAVARIEENLAAQKHAAPDDRLPEALQAIRHAVAEARAAAAQAGASAEAALAPVRGAAKTIREILMRLREIGADGRIYDLMDSQVSIIEAGCGEPALSDAGTALNAAFELIEQRIGNVERDDAAPDDHTPPDTATASRPDDIVAAPIEAAPAAEATQDDAVLDMIALEMAAPDFAENDAAEFCVPGYDPVAPLAVARATAPADAAEPILQPSLGASLIANGIVRTPATPAGDPLAPIRRMSQAEKIAFFS
ncbi:MAG TPA: hypothetical protein VFQ87_17980 [Bradyrhizobium sp.]|nr:hypothetical protein [Bradyrhizobium sp.]